MSVLRVGAGLAVTAALMASSAAAIPKPATPFDPMKAPAPVWLQKPSQSDFMRAFPPSAKREHVAGAAVIGCKVTAARLMVDCRMRGEDPPGYGFGGAALKMAGYFRLTPAGPGLPAEGDNIRIPFRFGAWMYRRPPPFNLHPGDAAILMTEMKGARPPGRSIFPCPTGSASRYCLWADVTWTRRPDVAATRAALEASDLHAGHTDVTCRPTDEGSLVDCSLSEQTSPKADAALQQLFKDFRVAPKAKDGSPVTDGRIVVEINWTLFHAMVDD